MIKMNRRDKVIIIFASAIIVIGVGSPLLGFLLWATEFINSPTWWCLSVFISVPFLLILCEVALKFWG